MSKRYLRTNGVAARYSVHPRSVPRMVKDKRIPKPALYSGRFPLWAEDELDESDRNAAREAPARRETKTTEKVAAL
jgi:predicted DNA-binding transcriptional regulator AlpA